jgi:hypothetical protein
VDVDAVHAFISGESYWGEGRTREFVERAIRGSARVVGLYRGLDQAGFARVVSDGTTVKLGFGADFAYPLLGRRRTQAPGRTPA